MLCRVTWHLDLDVGDRDRLESLVEMYEAAIAALHLLADPKVDQLIVRLEMRESEALRLLDDARLAIR